MPSNRTSRERRKRPVIYLRLLITALFSEVDDQLRAIPKQPEARLWPSEVVTLGLLHALKLDPKVFSVDITGVARMTSYARDFKEGWVRVAPIGAGSCASWNARRQHLVQCLSETRELLLRIVRRYQVVDDINQALHFARLPVDSPQCMQAGCF